MWFQVCWFSGMIFPGISNLTHTALDMVVWVKMGIYLLGSTLCFFGGTSFSCSRLFPSQGERDPCHQKAWYRDLFFFFFILILLSGYSPLAKLLTITVLQGPVGLAIGMCILVFWRLEVWEQSVGRIGFFRGPGLWLADSCLLCCFMRTIALCVSVF